MHPTFDDPLFAGRRGPGGGGEGVYDGQYVNDKTTLPLFGCGVPANALGDRIPPGARYDPVGPGGPRFPGPGRGGFGGAGGAPHNPFGGFGGNDFI